MKLINLGESLINNTTLNKINGEIILILIVTFVISMLATGGNPVSLIAVAVVFFCLVFSKKTFGKKKRKKYDFLSLESDFSNSFIQLMASVIKADGKTEDSEIRYVEKALLLNFPRTRVEVLLKHIKYNLEKEHLNITGICQLIRSNFNTASKVQLMHLLIGIAAADGVLTKTEEKLLRSIAVEIRLPFATFKQILSMFRFRYEGQQQQRKTKIYTSSQRLKSAFEVLGLTSEASEKEIKKAYRKLAVIHHPDKVAQQGKEVQKAANQQFLIISEAYELIKKKKNFS